MKNKSYLIIAVATLIAFTVAGTYAFFQVLGGKTETRNVTVQTSTTDSLTFNVTKDIEIEASRENFYQNAGNLSDTTTATARLVPNSKTNSATANYNVYVVIDSNNFVYTTEAHTPELLLTITDPDGNRHGNIVGLNGDNGVFDITTRTGAFLVAEDYEISASTAQGTTQTWTMTVTLVNLDTDQNNNTGKTLTGTIYITKEDLTTYSLAELNAIRTSRTNEQTGEEVSNIHSTSITVDVETTSGTEGIGTYYFGIEEQSSTGYINVANQTINGIEYFESNEPTYTFTNLKGNTDYNIYAFVEDGAGFKSNIYNTTVTTEEYILPSVINVSVTPTSLTSMSVTATASAGESQVSKYYFNCGDGNGWSEAQDSNVYTCSGLSYNTNYNVQVKVIDTYGEYSTDYVKPSEIRAYEVTYSCTNCTSSKNSEYVLAGGNSTATITPSTHYNLTSPTVSGCVISNGVVTVSGISSNTTCSVNASGNSVTCSAGEYLPAGTETCSGCTAGNYCTGGNFAYNGNVQGLTACSTLGTGYTSEAGASANTGCYITVAAGSYKTSLTGTTTNGCGGGKYSTSHKGYYNVADTACTNIDAGCYGTSGTTSCPSQCVASTATVAGTYSAAGQSSCTTATSGNYVASAKATAQAQCPAGSYCVDGKKAACSSLGTGYTSSAGANATTSCYLAVSAGYYKTSANGTGTAACSQGSYKAAHNSNYGSSDSCTACAGGKTNSGTGNSVACTTTCSNSANVATWKTPSWSANSVSNLCAANTCDSGYAVDGNDCKATSCKVYCTSSRNCTTTRPTNALYGVFTCGTNGKTGSIESCWYGNVQCNGGRMLPSYAILQMCTTSGDEYNTSLDLNSYCNSSAFSYGEKSVPYIGLSGSNYTCSCS